MRIKKAEVKNDESTLEVTVETKAKNKYKIIILAVDFRDIILANLDEGKVQVEKTD
jgi:hypothetical protein